MNRITITLLVSIFLLTACGDAAIEEAATAAPQLEKAVAIIPVIEGPFLNECKNCHTDKQRLIDTARPEEVVEKESSGAG